MTPPLRLVTDATDLADHNRRTALVHDFLQDVIVRKLRGWNTVPMHTFTALCEAWGYGDLLDAALNHKVTADDVRAAAQANRRNH